MKLRSNLALLLLASTATLAPILAPAGPVAQDVDVRCPLPNKIHNFGDHLIGQGLVKTQWGEHGADFYAKVDTKAFGNLANYFNRGANYTADTGTVFCLFANRDDVQKQFTLSYTLENGKGGSIKSQEPAIIYLSIPFGNK